MRAIHRWIHRFIDRFIHRSAAAGADGAAAIRRRIVLGDAAAAGHSVAVHVALTPWVTAGVPFFLVCVEVVVSLVKPGLDGSWRVR